MGAEDPLVKSGSLSELLANWQAGDQQTLEALPPGTYDELRRLAHRYLRKQRPDHTLQSTVLVHEAYLCLANQTNHQLSRAEL